MARITYLDPNDDAPKVTWQDVTFKAHLAQELDDERYKRLIEDASKHPYFQVESKQEEPSGKPTWPDEDARSEEQADERPKKGKR